MKNVKIFTIIGIIGIFGVFMSCDILSYLGNGDIVTSERTVQSFNKIESGGSAHVRFHKSQDEYRVVVTSDSNLIDFITTEVWNNTLQIGTKNGSYSFTKWEVDVYCPSLNGVSISGSGSFTSSEKIIAPDFISDISGSGKIEGIIECSTLSAAITGSGKMTVSGTAVTSQINISGSGKFNGYELITNSAVIIITGSGNADVYVSSSIKANVTGSGTLNYKGNPSVKDLTSTGIGRINQK